MANSNTEHSRKLRAKTAQEWNRKQIELGNIKIIRLQLNKEVAELFENFCQEKELSRPKALKALLDFYKENSN